MNRALEQNVIALRGIYKDNVDLIRYIMGAQNDTNADQMTNRINALLDHNDTILNNLNNFLNAHQPTNNNLNEYHPINRRRSYNNVRHNTPNNASIYNNSSHNNSSHNNSSHNNSSHNNSNMPLSRPSRLAREPETTPLQRLIQTYFMSQTTDAEFNRTSNFPSNSNLSSFFDPVAVFPSSMQLDRALRQVYYRDIVSPLNNSCPISLERFADDEIVTVIRHCNHIFRSDEINNWFRSNCRCPVCRYDIRGGYTSASIDASDNNIASNNATSNNASTNTTVNNSRNASATALDDLSTRILNTLYQDSSFNTILNSAIDPSNNLLATFYISYH